MLCLSTIKLSSNKTIVTSAPPVFLHRKTFYKSPQATRAHVMHNYVLRLCFKQFNLELFEFQFPMLTTSLSPLSFRSGYPLPIGAYDSEHHRQSLREDRFTSTSSHHCSLTLDQACFRIWGIARLKLPLWSCCGRCVPAWNWRGVFCCGQPELLASEQCFSF